MKAMVYRGPYKVRVEEKDVRTEVIGPSGSFVSLHPDNPITETGVLSEFSGHGLRSRFGKKRADLAHQWMDPAIVAGPWILAGAAVVAIARNFRRHKA